MNGFRPQLPTQGSLWQKTLISHPHIPHTQSGAACDANTHLIDGDGGPVGQIHLWSLFTLPQRSKEQRRVQGAILA